MMRSNALSMYFFLKQDDFAILAIF
jgi:hypothetical protein